MSYDFSIGDVSLNHTSNGAAIFYDHMPEREGSRGGLHSLDGLTGRQACVVIADTFERMNRTRRNVWRSDSVGEPEFRAKYDAPNGWGSTVSSMLFLAQILAACANNPRKKVRLSA